MDSAHKNSPPRGYTINLNDPQKNDTLFIFGIGAVSFILLIFGFYDGLLEMIDKWTLEEYSHGYLIPLVSLLLVFQKLPQVTQETPKNRWLSIVFLIAGLAMLIIGKLSTIFIIMQYGFIVALASILIAIFGMNGLRKLWAPIVYLSFMIPLPNFLYANLSSQLQLLSSNIGVFIIRLFDISVFLEGNIIDLGNYKLQVVEACSGLRYLFPLLSFGFLIAYLFQAPIWQRVIIFFTTIPITIVMNSFRIAIIGITVNYWGIAAAEGFLHDFEGWVVFIACLSLLMLEIFIFHKILYNKGHFFDRIDLTFPSFSDIKIYQKFNNIRDPLIIFIVALLIVVPFSLSIDKRLEKEIDRPTFSLFPLLKGDWTGHESNLENNIIDTLKFTDYFIADFTYRNSKIPLNLYVAYYNSQRSGASIHSPRSCIPGGGWRIKQIENYVIRDIPNPKGEPLKVNRAIIQNGDEKSIVYYWFQQRGRIITNEYLAKWFLFWDSLTQNRTDGALVRIVVPLSSTANEVEIDQHIEKFLEEFNPLLHNFIPN
ncbi:MAG: VPLPA-CTERM-specific exosortase XrtD [Cellvibrionaceae bacterium]